MITYYTTHKGEKIQVQSFPHMLPGKVQLAADKKAKELYPAVHPTYDEPLMGGGVQTFQHDEKSLQTDADRESWNIFQENSKKQVLHVNDMMMKFYILTGTVVELPTNQKWVKRQEFFGIELPTDENELLYHYITTELLGDVSDLVDLVNCIMEASGIDKETMEAAKASFRGVLGKAESTIAGLDRSNDGSRSASGVDNIPTVSSNGSDGTLELVTIPVG